MRPLADSRVLGSADHETRFRDLCSPELFRGLSLWARFSAAVHEAGLTCRKGQQSGLRGGRRTAGLRREPHGGAPVSLPNGRSRRAFCIETGAWCCSSPGSESCGKRGRPADGREGLRLVLGGVFSPPCCTARGLAESRVGSSEGCTAASSEGELGGERPGEKPGGDFGGTRKVTRRLGCDVVDEGAQGRSCA